VNALTIAVAAAWLPAMTVRSKPSDVTGGGQTGPLRQVADGFRALASSASVATFVTFSVLASFVYGSDTVLFIPTSATQLHTGASGYGYLLAGIGVGGIAGAAVINRLAARPRLGLEALADAATEVTVQVGAVIIAEGDRADACYVLTGGRADVSAAGPLAHPRSRQLLR
jgi:Transmembrane secretion effector